MAEQHPDQVAEDRMRNTDAALRNLERTARAHEETKPWEQFTGSVVPTYDTPFTSALEDRGLDTLEAEATRRLYCQYLEMLDEIGDPRLAFAAFDLHVQKEVNRLARVGMNSTNPIGLAITQARMAAAADLLQDGLSYTRNALAEERRALDEANTASTRFMVNAMAASLELHDPL